VADVVASGRPPESADFKAAWTEARWADALAAAQDGLCAWCTVRPLDGGHVGTVDHVRPRSEVARDLDAPGEEVGVRGRVEDRLLLPRPLLRPGYYFRAYDPDNLVFACERCNTGWKRTLWPVRPWHDPASWRAPDPATVEDELVLDPFEDGFDPLRHFRFGAGGAILHHAADERAEATIATLALDHQSLCEARAVAHRDLEIDARWIRRALQSATLDAGGTATMQRVARRCHWSSPHAAFYRAALKQTLRGLGVAWSDLRAALTLQGVTVDVSEPADETWID
jgi:hypothetical protein